MSARTKNIEIRSEEVQDILSRPPKWMIRWGNSVVMLLILGVLGFSYLVKYPDVILGRAIISTETPPAFITTNSRGRISRLLVLNDSMVSEGDIIAEVDNPIPHQSITYLSGLITEVESYLSGSGIYPGNLNDSINLYDASSIFLELKATVESYHDMLTDGSSGRELENLKTKRDNFLKIRQITQKEAELAKEDIANAAEKFEMQKKEYELGISSKLAFLNAQSTYNQSRKSQEAIKKNLIQIDLSIIDYETQISTFIQNRRERIKSLETQIKSLLISLKNYIVKWNNNYTLRSPAYGRLSYLSRVKENQLVNAGDELFAIIPSEGGYEVEIDVPLAGFGKIKPGHEVKLRLDNYPYEEYGMILGEVSALSALPNENTYRVKVDLTNGLKSSYDIDIEHTPEMFASAEIVTDDLRLIERIFFQILKIIDQ